MLPWAVYLEEGETCLFTSSAADTYCYSLHISFLTWMDFRLVSDLALLQIGAGASYNYIQDHDGMESQVHYDRPFDQLLMQKRKV